MHYFNINYVIYFVSLTSNDILSEKEIIFYPKYSLLRYT